MKPSLAAMHDWCHTASHEVAIGLTYNEAHRIRHQRDLLFRHCRPSDGDDEDSGGSSDSGGNSEKEIQLLTVD